MQSPTQNSKRGFDDTDKAAYVHDQTMCDSLETHGKFFTLGEIVRRTLLVCQDHGRSDYIERIVDKAVANLVDTGHIERECG